MVVSKIVFYFLSYKSNLDSYFSNGLKPPDGGPPDGGPPGGGPPDGGPDNWPFVHGGMDGKLQEDVRDAC